jgi:photosynthetic reaction center cytochrome c subunit
MYPRAVIDKKRIVLALAVVAFSAVDVFLSQGQSSSKTADVTASAQTLTSQFPSEATGASRCQVCHASEVEGYARSAMAHSLRRAGQEPDGVVATAQTTIEMHTSPSGYWQRLQNGDNVVNYRIDYVVGSGNHASGYLLDLAGHLFQSPVAYYKSKHAYDLAPGYEGLSNPDFTRPIAEMCLFCHSGDSLKIRGTVNEYGSPVFSAEAITCERCHGSAEKHLHDPRAGTIVNPAKLDRAARDSICEQCHLLGVGRVLNPGKSFSDFAAGERLEDVFTTYVNVSPPGAGAEKFKVISHVEQLARSTCARMSMGRLWCGTCHDPHNKPLEPIKFFRSRCLSCHAKAFARSHPAKDSNCIGCHMPRRDAKDGGHTAFTDHRIQRRPQPDETLPSNSDIAAWREPAPEMQKRNLGIAYVNTGMERHSAEFLIRGYQMLAEVQSQFKTDSELYTWIGTALLAGNKTPEAALAFERALQLNPNSVTGETNAASAYLQAGDSDRAIVHLEDAVAIDPLYLPADVPLIALYKQQGNTARAEELSAKVTAATQGQSFSDEVSEKPASDRPPQDAKTVFKNIQVLEEIPSDQLIPTMRFIATSLGVECSYCHEKDHFEKDDKKPKQIARQMMRMMSAINDQNFAGNREVTCYSCHRGSPKPEAVPTVASEDPHLQATPLEDKLPGATLTADQLIEKYIEALGGAAAIQAITSREETGTTTFGGQSIPVEVFDEDPGKQILLRHMPSGDSVTVFNGREGWSSAAGRPIRDIHGSDVIAAEMDADLHFPLHIRQLFAELRVEYPEKVGDREAYVISCKNVGQPPVKLYFDEESGLLERLVRYAASPLGLVPTQIDYADYRDAGGVKAPFRRTTAQWDGTSTIQLEQIQENIPIDEAKFAKPAPQESPKAPWQ